MALVVYDVSQSVVSKYLNQWTMSSATLPGTTDIDTDGEWLNVAAADVEDAMLEGGFDSSTVTSASTPSAYYQLRNIVAERAALYYIRSVSHNIPEVATDDAWARNNEKLSSIRAGERVGELVNADGPQRSYRYIGSDTDDDLDDIRFQIDDTL